MMVFYIFDLGAHSPGFCNHMSFVITKELCLECGKTVYATEKLVADEKIFHKSKWTCGVDILQIALNVSIADVY